MTQAPSYPPVHSYEGENPWELIPSPYGIMERWRANAMQTGEVSGLTALSDRVKNDAVGALEELEERERKVIEREQACDARERHFAVQVAKFSEAIRRNDAIVGWLEKAKADTEEEPLASPPGAATDPSKEPEPSLAPEDTVQPAHGDPPGEPATTDQEVEFPTGELPTPPVTAQPVSPGLDAEEFEEEKHGD